LISHDVDSQAADATLTPDQVGAFVLGQASEKIVALSGVDGAALREYLEQVDPGAWTRRALLVPLSRSPKSQEIVEQIIAKLAETALRMWPVWYTDVDFGQCRDDRLGRLATGIIASTAAQEVAGASTVWADRAAKLALSGTMPRVASTPQEIELAQLSRVISRSGLTIVADFGAAADWRECAAAVVRAIEWTAKHSGGAVVALFDELPPAESPFDRILYNSRKVIRVCDTASGSSIVEPNDESSWIAPWRGMPHPLSDIEKRLGKAIMSDGELAPLFGFNQPVETVRGSRPKVDLLWSEGRLVVEIDGYESHCGRRAFMDDRHRDYELMLSGFLVLRLANEEIAQDCEKAVDKIRDLVRLRQAQFLGED
jgi:hypothetical protein